LQQRLGDLRNDFSLSGEEKLDLKDFLAGMIDKSVLEREDRLRMVFDHFRKSNDNWLQLSDLIELFGRESLAQEVMAGIDTGGNNKISFEEFRIVMAHSFSSNDK